uniref:Glycosyltransferase n=1 Tax=Populus trichocarpa TaxID=3694 RepID=A0A2K1Y9U9_POPTR|eukprot:XP_002318584.3 UDP-glycosyltransferase 89B2 [Populus trichocarpa]
MSAGAHVLLFPFPAQGHLIPLLDLAHHLVIRGLTITILVTPKNLPILNPLLSKNSTINTLVLPFPNYPSIPLGIENLKDLPPNIRPTSMIHALGELYQPLLSWFRSHPSPPVAIISDMFLGWTHRLACQLGVRRFVFSPSGAMALATMYSLWQEMPNAPKDQNELFSFSKIPSCPKYPWLQISTIYRSYVEGDPVSEFTKEGMEANIASWGLIVNSLTLLEGIYFEHLRKQLGHDRVWAVGPILPEKTIDMTPPERGVSMHDLKTWLDTCEDHKVVYVCYGTQVVLTKYQMEAVASGLEKSGVHFIWCVKQPSKEHVGEGYSMIPSGFEDRVAGRGLIIRGWAPQVWILSHRAVGAFLTHCGWNSILEGIVAGVPMLACPMAADQFVGATLLVEELKVAKRVCDGANLVSNSAKLARTLMESVSDESRVEKERAKELRMAALDAIKEDGSSDKHLNAFVKHVVGLGMETDKG